MATQGSRGQDPTDFIKIGVALIALVGIGYLMIGLVAGSISDVADTLDTDSLEANLTNDGITEMSTGADNIGTMQTIGFAVLIIMMLFGGLYFLFGR